LEILNIYEFVIGETVRSYTFAGYPQPRLDRVIVDEVGHLDEVFYKNLMQSSKYNRYKLSFDEIEKLRTRDRYEYTEKKETTIRISDEFFYSAKGEFIFYYQISESGGGEFYRLHFKKNMKKYEVIEIIEEGSYKE
jgi:hypothetical protein